jgi:hypothetical protein
MRKAYSNPDLKVVELGRNDVIATSVTTINSNTGIGLGGAGHGTVRTPGQRGIWE